jgi:hypothetical protein
MARPGLPNLERTQHVSPTSSPTPAPSPRPELLCPPGGDQTAALTDSVDKAQAAISQLLSIP